MPLPAPAIWATTMRGVRALCRFLAESAESPVRRYTPAGQDIDAVFDLRAIFQQRIPKLAIETLPALLLPRKGRHGLRRLREGVLPGPEERARHLRPARHRPGAAARWWWCGRTSTSPTCCRSTRIEELAGFFAGFMLPG